MADPKEIAKQFANFYYSIFDGDRQNLVSLYVCRFSDRLDLKLIYIIIIER